MDTVAERVEEVRRRVAQAAVRSGRAPDSVRLVAVSKTIGVGLIGQAVAAGVRDFGENYVQEAREKLPEFGRDVRWHFIGHLQSNKARHVVGAFALIHSVDSLSLAREISKRAVAIGVAQDVLIEVRLDPAATKAGVDPADAPLLAEAVLDMPGIRLRGLMGMPPLCSDPEAVRPHFRQLAALRADMPGGCGDELSMGMSGDFEVAIEEGATLVRVGTAIFGPRS